MEVCIKAEKPTMFPFEISVLFGQIHKVGKTVPSLIWELVNEFEERYPDFDASQYSVFVL